MKPDYNYKPFYSQESLLNMPDFETGDTPASNDEYQTGPYAKVD